MIFASSPLRDALPTGSFSCSAIGTCTGTSPGVQIMFRKLQEQMNRVRKIYGLPADVVVDGKIGASTTAKLIKLAQKIAASIPSAKLDSTIEGYAIEVSGQLPKTSQVARDASDLVSALMRNGYAPGYVPPPQQSSALIDPYLDAITGGSGAPTIKRPNVPANLVVGPTASAGGAVVPSAGYPPDAYAAPAFARSSGLAVAGVVLGVLALAGIGAAAWKATR